MERTQQSTPQPTPVVYDAHANSAQLHQRAAVDYARAQASRQQDSGRRD